VRLQLISELRWIYHSAQIFRQCIPCRGIGVWERTFTEICIQPRHSEISWQCWSKARARQNKFVCLRSVSRGEPRCHATNLTFWLTKPEQTTHIMSTFGKCQT